MIGCGSPHFERVLQRDFGSAPYLNVVEALILRGYYNPFALLSYLLFVVEALILRGYYNIYYS